MPVQSVTPPREVPTRETPPKKRTAADKKLQDQLQQTYVTLGFTIVGVGTVKQDNGIAGTGMAIVEHSEAVADAWIDLADQNPKVKAALKKAMAGSAVATLAGIHVTMLAPFMLDRGILPAAMFGQPQPESQSDPSSNGVARGTT